MQVRSGLQCVFSSSSSQATATVCHSHAKDRCESSVSLRQTYRCEAMQGHAALDGKSHIPGSWCQVISRPCTLWIHDLPDLPASASPNGSGTSLGPSDVRSFHAQNIKSQGRTIAQFKSLASTSNPKSHSYTPNSWLKQSSPVFRWHP